MKKQLETYTLEAAQIFINSSEILDGFYGNYLKDPSLFYEVNNIYIEKVENYLSQHHDQTLRFNENFGGEDYLIMVEFTLIKPGFHNCECSTEHLIFDDFLNVIDEPLDYKLERYLAEYNESNKSVDFRKKLLGLRMPYQLNISIELAYFKKGWKEKIPYLDKTKVGYTTIISVWNQDLENGVNLASYFLEESITKDIKCYQFPELCKVIDVQHILKKENQSFRLFLLSKLKIDVTAFYESNFQILNE